jgi:hypothetical protein
MRQLQVPSVEPADALSNLERSVLCLAHTRVKVARDRAGGLKVYDDRETTWERFLTLGTKARATERAEKMNKGATDHVLTIVRLLAKGADDSRLSPNEVDLLNQNVTALIQQDRDDLVRAFLTAVKEAEGVLTPNLAQKLASYP